MRNTKTRFVKRAQLFAENVNGVNNNIAIINRDVKLSYRRKNIRQSHTHGVCDELDHCGVDRVLMNEYNRNLTAATPGSAYVRTMRQRTTRLTKCSSARRRSIRTVRHSAASVGGVRAKQWRPPSSSAATTSVFFSNLFFFFTTFLVPLRTLRYYTE